MKRLPALLTFVLLSCAHARTGATHSGSPLEVALRAGEEALDRGDPEAAIESLDRAVQLDPHSTRAHRKRVEAYLRLGRSTQIIALYRSSLANGDDPLPRYALALTLYASTTDNAKESLDLLRSAENLAPDEAEFPFRQGVILLDQERYDESIKLFRRAVELQPDRATYRVPLALALHHAGQKAESMKVLSDLLTLAPTPAEVNKARAVANALTGRFTGVPEAARGRLDQAIGWLEKADVPQNAIDLLRDILLEFPDLGMAHALLGLAYQRIESGGEALMHFRHAIQLSPDGALPFLYLGNFYLSKDRHADAAEAYRDALRNNPLLLAPHQMLAEMGVQAGNDRQAETHLRAWILLDRDNVYPRLTLARILTRHGRIAEAEAELATILSLQPANLEAHLGLAAIAVHRFERAKTKGSRKKERQTAMEHLEWITDAQPDNGTAKILRKKLDG